VCGWSGSTLALPSAMQLVIVLNSHEVP
jgi:hypothetical protein